MADDNDSKVLNILKIGEADTPSSLAQHYYGDASKWEIILDCNDIPIKQWKKHWRVGLEIKIPRLPPPPEDNPISENAHLVKIDIANLEGRKLLQEDITMLNGVSDEAAEVLRKRLKIVSIFDLAMSHYFNVARSLLNSGSPLEAAFLQHGFIPGDTFRGDPKTIDLNWLKNADIGELNFSDKETAGKLKDALKIKTIRDMAFWPPFQSARQIMLSTFDPTGVTRKGEDPEAPSDLIPACGNFPTECVYYTSVFLDEIDVPGKTLDNLNESGGVSLFPEKVNIQGFDRPAKGGILTYKQSWYAQGVTLGQLLHSLALAPGESTRIAMVDWYRRTGEKTTEEIAESEALSQTSRQSRSISEITRAVATEMQQGYNQSSASSASARAGFGWFGWSAGGSTNSSLATSVSRSFGQRDMAAEMNQRILSSTQQNATAERSRRATIVRECYQEEKETLTTRAVTNYNHMHALTVQYYEVVQVYRVRTELWKAERVLFIPMKEINFGDPRVFARYKELLKTVAVNEIIRNKLDAWKSSYADLTFNPDDENARKAKRIHHSPVLQSIGYVSNVDIAKIKVTTFKDDETHEQNLGREGTLELNIDLSELKEIQFEFNKVSVGQEENKVPTPGCTLKYTFKDSLGQVTDFADIVRPAVIEETVTKAGSETQDTDDQEENQPRIFAVSPVKVMKAKFIPQLEEEAEFDLIQHLQETPHYSHAIWLSLDPLTLSQMLAGYKYGEADKPLASQVDPTPVAITGNYLGFRWSGDKDEPAWRKNIKKNSKEVDAEIPLPSGGVFAEAVLGRFNSAEKLDITRYWNWQDSPIPFTASDIAALSAGGKSEQSTPAPGQLSQPAVTINAAPTLPDPTGMRDMMQAIAVSNMFRDMSNQAATAALAGQSLETASKGAGEAAEQASENYQTTIKTLGEVAKEVIPLVATKGLSAASISKVGAAANLAGKLDEKESTSPDGNGTGNQETVLSSLLGVATKLVGKK